jgi:hypothetical protein
MSKIAVVGCEASGKTVFMAAMTDQYRPDPDRPDRPCLVPENSAANSFGAFLRRQMRSLRMWPPATNPGRTVEMEWTLRRGGKAIADLGMLEFGGETLRAAFRDEGGKDAQREAVDSLMRYLGDCGFFIVLVSIKELLRDPGTMSMADFERDTEAIWVTRGIIDFVRTRIPGAGVVVGLTQADRYRDELERAGGPERLLARRWPTIAAITADIKVVPVASVSATDADGNPAEGFVTDGILPVTQELENWLKSVKPRPAQSAKPIPSASAQPSGTNSPRKREVGLFVLLFVSMLVALAGIVNYYWPELVKKVTGPSADRAAVTAAAAAEPGTAADVQSASVVEPETNAVVPAASVVEPETNAVVPAAAVVETDVASESATVAEAARPEPETVTNAVEEAVAPASASATVTNDVAAVNPPPSPRVLSKEEKIFSNRYARAMSGDARYKRWLANQYYAGTEFAKRNARLARQLYREAGESGDVRSMAYYAAMAENGEGGDWNVSDAIAWYRKAAEGGHADAMYRTGLACWNDRDSSDELVTEANAWFRKAKAAKCTFVNVDAWIRKTESAPAANSRQPAYAE